jgi:hypothetical protein
MLTGSGLLSDVTMQICMSVMSSSEMSCPALNLSLSTLNSEHANKKA